jgi:hypothetical protein
MSKLALIFVVGISVIANTSARSDCYSDWQACRYDAVDDQRSCLRDCESDDYKCRRDCRGSLNADLGTCSNKANYCLQSNSTYPGPIAPGPYPAPNAGPYPGPVTGPYSGPGVPSPQSPNPYVGPGTPNRYPGPGPGPGPPLPNSGPVVSGPMPPKPNPTGPCPNEAYEYKMLRPGAPPVRIRKPTAPGYC